MKKQIWLRPDQVELVYRSLEVVREGLRSHAKISGNTSAKMACEYTEMQINEVLALLDGKAA